MENVETLAEPVIEAPEPSPEPPKDKAPAKKRKRRGGGTWSPERKAAASERMKGITGRTKIKGDILAIMGAVAIPLSLADPVCAQTIMERGEPLAKALADLAAKNPRVYRMLTAVSKGTEWGAVVVASGNLLIPILAHHRMVPERLGKMLAPEVFADVGSVPPETDDEAKDPQSPPANWPESADMLARGSAGKP